MGRRRALFCTTGYSCASRRPAARGTGLARNRGRWIVGKYLVVANQTLGGEHLIEEVRRRAAAGPSPFYVVGPNTPAGDAAPASGAPLAPPPVMSGSSEDEDHRATLIAQTALHH